MSSTSNILQQAYILATGNAASSSLLAEFEALVHADGGSYARVAQIVEGYMGGVAAAQGVAATVKALAINGLGIALTDDEAIAIKADLAAHGVVSWADIFQFCILLQGGVGVVLDNRATVAEHFNDTLASLGKSGLFSGETVAAAVKTMLQNVGASADSLSAGINGVDSVAGKLTAQGLQSNAADGYLANASVFIDTNNNLQLDDGEFHTTTDAAGNFTLPANGAGTIVVTGGTDLLTGAAFHGTLTALAGGTQVNPFTSMVQTLLHDGSAATVGAASALVAQALGLPEALNLLSYDPLAVLASKTAGADEVALALKVQALAIELSNVIAQLGSILDAANGTGAPVPAAAVASALAAAIAAGAHDADGMFDPSSAADLEGVVEAAANAAGLPGIAAQAQTIAGVIAAGNAKAAAAGDITALAKVATVTQGVAVTKLIEAGASGNFSDAVHDLMGSPLTILINKAVPGEVAPGVPVPGGSNPSSPSQPKFLVKVDSGVVTFNGDATGDIFVSWSGAPGASVATFERHGITANVKPDFASSATSIFLAAGQNIATNASNVTNLTVDGPGTVTLSDMLMVAATLAGIDSRMSSTVIATGMTSLSGTSTDILAITGSSGVTTTGAFEAVVSDTISVATANSIDAATTGVVTATLASDSAANLAALTGSGNAYTTTVTTGSAAAADLNAIDSATTVTVDATAATNVTGTAAAILTAFYSYGILLTPTITVTVTDTVSVADANDIDGAVTGVVTATIAEGDLVTLAGLTGTGNAYTVVVTDTVVGAAALTTLAGKTTIAVDATAADSIDGDAAAIVAVIDNANITKPSDFDSDISASDTAAADLIAILADNGTGTIDASAATSLDGTATNILTIIDSTDVTKPPVFDSTLAAGVELATDLSLISAANGAGGIIDASALTSIDGSASAIVAVINDGDITKPADFDSLITNNASQSANLLIVSGANGTGTIDATGVNSINGSARNIADVIADTSILKPAAFDSTISGTTAQAADLLDISAGNGMGGLIDAGAVTTINGSAANLALVVGDADITRATDFDSKVTGNNAVASNLLVVAAGNGTGTIDATGLNAINGTASDVADVFADSSIQHQTDVNVTVSGTADATDLTAIANANGTPTVNANNVTSIDGAAADIIAVINDATIDKANNFGSVIAAGTALAASLLTISGANGNGTIDALSVTSIDGTAADVVSVINDNHITTAGNFDSTIAAGALAATDLLAISNHNGSGIVYAGAGTSIDGDANKIVNVINDAEISTPATYDSLISGSTVNASLLNQISADNGLGTVNASGAIEIDGSAAQIATLLGDASILHNAVFDSTLTGTSANAAHILTIANGNTTGFIHADALGAINGTTANILAVLADPSISRAGTFDSTISNNTVGAASLLQIEGVNGTGSINATGATTMNGSGFDVSQALQNASISLSGTVNLTATNASAFQAGIISAYNTTGITSIELENAYTTGSTLNGLITGDKIDIDANNTTANMNNGVASAALVTGNGKYFFDSGTKLFTWWDNNEGAANSITLTGVLSVTAAGDFITIG